MTGSSSCYYGKAWHARSWTCQFGVGGFRAILGRHQGFEQRSSNCGRRHHCSQRTILSMHARAVSIGRWCGGNSSLHNNGQPLSRESRGLGMGCGSSGQKFDGECLRIPRVGDIARRYAISGELGRGTFATCYLARYGLCKTCTKPCDWPSWPTRINYTAMYMPLF